MSESILFTQQALKCPAFLKGIRIKELPATSDSDSNQQTFDCSFEIDLDIFSDKSLDFFTSFANTKLPQVQEEKEHFIFSIISIFIQEMINVSPDIYNFSLNGYYRGLEFYSIETFPEDLTTIRKNIKEYFAQMECLYAQSLIDEGHWYEGLDLLEKSLAIFRQIDNLEWRADTIYHIARTHHLMLNLDKARMYYRDARRLYQHIGEEPGIAACHTGLGRLMLRLGFVDDALAELNQ
ncbi:MAG: tetratricopeptide repeat protein, partial [Prochloron sp. SP5CPC1]|nr:tetratricopeptide repeat protein [Candidatus Paraprochloron terpiosi SP5CPC1]